jgi:hypothetical protein
MSGICGIDGCGRLTRSRGRRGLLRDCAFAGDLTGCCRIGWVTQVAAVAGPVLCASDLTGCGERGREGG